MFQICPKIPGQKFLDPPFEEEILAFLSDLGYIDNLTNQSMKESEAYKTYYAFVTGKAIPKPKYVTRSGKKKQIAKGLETLSEIVLSEAKEMKLAIERSKTQLHSSQPSGSGAHERTGVSPGVLDVPTYGSDDERMSWKSNDEEDDDDETNVSKDEDEDDQEDVDDQGDDDEWTDSDNDGDDFVHPKFSTHDEEDKEEDRFDPRVQTPSHIRSTDDEDNDEEIQGVNVEGDNEEETNEEVKANELYGDMNVNLVGRDTEMTDAPRTIIQTTQVIEDTHVIITPMFRLLLLLSHLFLSATTLHPPPTPLITHLRQTPVPTPATVPRSSLKDLPNFGSLFGFDHRLKALEDDFLEFKQKNQFAKVVSLIPGIVDTFLVNKMNEAVKTAVQLLSDKLRDEAQAKNEDFINKLDENIKKITTEQVKEQKNLYKELVDAYECDKLILDTYGDTVTIKRRRDVQDEDKETSAGSNRGSKRRRAGKEPESTNAPKEKTSKSTGKSKEGLKSHQEHTGKFTQAEEPIHADKELEEPAHQELKVDTLTPELLACPTFKLIKGSCKSLVVLEYFLEEVCKATTDKLDWNNPEGQQYPHHLRKPLPLIPNSRGHQVIPFEHFINNDLAYLSGGVSSQIYTTSVTKTKVVDYGHIKWIEDLFPNAMWSQVPVS
nr:hypothetical protein [Tanacetum cinerariifolium]